MDKKAGKTAKQKARISVDGSLDGAEFLKKYKKELKEIRNWALKQEEKNFSKLILFRVGRDWWKLGGNSALIYYADLAPRLGLNPRLLKDLDFGEKFEDGVISVRKVEKFIENLKKIKVELMTRSDFAVVFKLKMALTETEMEKIKKSEAVKEESLRDKMITDFLSPKLLLAAEELAKAVYEGARKGNSISRQFYLDDMAREGVVPLRIIKRMANKEMKPEEGILKIKERNERVAETLFVAFSLGLMDIKTCARIQTKLERVREMVRVEERKINLLEKERLEKEEQKENKKEKKEKEK